MSEFQFSVGQQGAVGGVLEEVEQLFPGELVALHGPASVLEVAGHLRQETPRPSTASRRGSVLSPARRRRMAQAVGPQSQGVSWPTSP